MPQLTGITLSIRRNDIPRVIATVQGRATQAVRDNAHAMRDYAASIAPVQTGALRESLYVSGPGFESDYIVRAAAALSRRPNAEIVPESQAATMSTRPAQLRNAQGQFSIPQAIVGSAVRYSLDLEMGTVHMAPRPTLHRAAIVYEPRLLATMQRIADGF